MRAFIRDDCRQTDPLDYLCSKLTVPEITQNPPSSQGRQCMRLLQSALFALWLSMLTSCTPRPASRDESLVIALLRPLIENEVEDSRPHLLSLRSVSDNLDDSARRRVIANITSRGHRFVDNASVTSADRMTLGGANSRFRGELIVRIEEWRSAEEAVVYFSNSPAPLIGGGARVRVKKSTSSWTVEQVLEEWVY